MIGWETILWPLRRPKAAGPELGAAQSPFHQMLLSLASLSPGPPVSWGEAPPLSSAESQGCQEVILHAASLSSTPLPS